jgi:hypothetical protein
MSPTKWMSPTNFWWEAETALLLRRTIHYEAIGPPVAVQSETKAIRPPAAARNRWRAVSYSTAPAIIRHVAHVLHSGSFNAPRPSLSTPPRCGTGPVQMQREATMAKSKEQGRRGERGLPGPRGPRGDQGKIGHTGKPGRSGPRGTRGRIGRTGPRSPLSPAAREELLSQVQGQIDEVHRALTEQIRRMDSLRSELEALRANFASLLAPAS